jgi:hypothetical protein
MAIRFRLLLPSTRQHKWVEYRPYDVTINRGLFGYLGLFFSIAQQPLVGQGLLIIGASRSHSFSHTTLGRTPLNEWSARCRDLYLTAPGGIRTRNPSPQAAADPRLRSRGHRDWHIHPANGNAISPSFEVCLFYSTGRPQPTADPKSRNYTRQYLHINLATLRHESRTA